MHKPVTLAQPPGQTAQPVAPGLALGTPVLTLDGTLPVEYLVPGDRIVTRRGMRVLRDISVSHSAAALCTLDAPGAAVTADTRVVLRDWRARIVYGRDTVLVPAASLAEPAAQAAPVPVFTLVFDEAEVVYAGGTEIACPARRRAL